MQSVPRREKASLHKRIASMVMLEQKLASMLFEMTDKKIDSFYQSYINWQECDETSKIKIGNTEKETK
jgi:hypothetical protein